jgi:hypothetical protein
VIISDFQTGLPCSVSSERIRSSSNART